MHVKKLFYAFITYLSFSPCSSYSMDHPQTGMLHDTPPDLQTPLQEISLTIDNDIKVHLPPRSTRLESDARSIRALQRTLARRRSIANEQDIKNFSQNFDTSGQQKRPRRHSSIELHEAHTAAAATPVDRTINRFNSFEDTILHRSASKVGAQQDTIRRGHRNSTGSDDIHNRPHSTQPNHKYERPHHSQRPPLDESTKSHHGRRFSFDETINHRHGRRTHFNESSHPHYTQAPTYHHGHHNSLNFDPIHRLNTPQREHSSYVQPPPAQTGNTHHKHGRPTHGRHGSHSSNNPQDELPHAGPDQENTGATYCHEEATTPHNTSSETPPIDRVEINFDEELGEESEYSSSSSPSEKSHHRHHHQPHRRPTNQRPSRNDEYNNTNFENEPHQRPMHHNQRPRPEEYNNNNHYNQNEENTYHPHNQRPSEHPEKTSGTVDWDQVYQFRDYPLIAFVIIAYGHYPKTTVTCIVLAGLLAGAFAIRKHEAIAEWWNSAKEKANDFMDFTRKKINRDIAQIKLNASSYATMQAIRKYYISHFLNKKTKKQS